LLFSSFIIEGWHFLSKNTPVHHLSVIKNQMASWKGFEPLTGGLEGYLISKAERRFNRTVLKAIKIASDVKLDEIENTSSNFSGSDLFNLFNRAS
jgi:hypothetical protein